MPSPWYSLFLVVFMTLIAQESYALDWSDHARRFTGESDRVKDQAVRLLRNTPKIENTLRNALQGSKMHLALDVISTLKLQNLLPDLIKLSEKDESGYAYHAINSLVNSKNRPDIILLYSTRLNHPATSSASKIALLDSLGRLQTILKEEQLTQLLRHEDFEVRSAALYYIRHLALKLGHSDFISLTGESLYPQVPFQLRLQTLYFYSELPLKQRRSIRSYFKRCESDPHPEVKKLCLELLRPFS